MNRDIMCITFINGAIRFTTCSHECCRVNDNRTTERKQYTSSLYTSQNSTFSYYHFIREAIEGTKHILFTFILLSFTH